MKWRVMLAIGSCAVAGILIAVGAGIETFAADELRDAQHACELMSLNHPMTCDPERLMGSAGIWADNQVAPRYPEEHRVVKASVDRRGAHSKGWIVAAVFLAMFGVAPLIISLAWRFLLNRIAELSDAIRGNR